MTEETPPRRATFSGNLTLGDTDGAFVISRRPKTTIVMFSGGIDSTYTVVKLLEETTDELLVHHIHFINSEGRHKVEAERARQIVEHCRTTYRPLTYSESALDHRAFDFFGFDMIGVGFEVGLVAHSHYDKMSRMPDRWMIGSCTDEGRNSDRWPHVLACMAANCFPEEPPAYFGFPIISKAEEIDYLPDEIVDMAWTCRSPVWTGDEPSECGQCITCRIMQQVRDD